MKVALKNILPNPYRDLERNPLDGAIVVSLGQSVKDTGFWDNLLARRHPTKKNKFELAYGHHRYAALQNVYSPDHEIQITVRKLSNELMVRIMANENEFNRNNSHLATQESIRAALRAYADGDVEFPPVDPNTKKSNIYDAPSTIDVGRVNAQHPYTVSTLALFLNWTRKDADRESGVKPVPKLVRGFAALQAVDRGLITYEQSIELKNEQTQAVVDAAELAFEEARDDGLTVPQAKKQSRAVAEETISRINDAKYMRDEAKKVRSEIRLARLPEPEREKEKIQDINKFAKQLQDGIDKFFRDEDRHEKLNELVKHAEYLDSERRHWLCQGLRAMVRDAKMYADKLAIKPVAVKTGGDV